jgi:hypothetical protein
MFSKPVTNWNNGWCEVVRKYVKFIQFYYTLEQIAAIVGPGKEQEILAFKRADLDKVTDWVPSQHGLPRTKDERRQEMMMLFDKGALDVNNPDVRKELYTLFGHTGMMKTFNKHATNARLENQAILNGAGWLAPAGTTVPGADGQSIPTPIPGPDGQVKPPIMPQPLIEDLDTHLHFHIDQAISPDFKKWPPPAQVALIKHIELTTMQRDLKMAKAMTMTALAKGGAKGLPAGGPKGMLGPGQGKTQSQSQGEQGEQASQLGGQNE